MKKKRIAELMGITEGKAAGLRVRDVWDGQRYTGPEAAAEEVLGYLAWRRRSGEGEDPESLLLVRRPRAGIADNYFQENELKDFFREMKKRAGMLNQVRDLFLFRLAYRTGLRVDEISRLRVGSVLERGSIDVRKRIEVIGKGTKRRMVTLSSDIRDRVRQFVRWKRKQGEDLGADDPLFVSLQGNRMARRTMQERFDHWQIEIYGERRITFHGWRHSKGTHHVGRNPTGKGLASLQEELGHESIETTRKYIHVSDADREEAVEQGGVPV